MDGVAAAAETGGAVAEVAHGRRGLGAGARHDARAEHQRRALATAALGGRRAAVCEPPPAPDRPHTLIPTTRTTWSGTTADRHYTLPTGTADTAGSVDQHYTLPTD